MGSCLSSSSDNEYQYPTPTAKVITTSGLLWEFSSPVAANLVLGDDHHSLFLCNSDHLLLDEHIPALRSTECILPGELYFMLPTKMLQSPLSGPDMASLAIRAKDALPADSVEKPNNNNNNKRKKRKKDEKVLPVAILPVAEEGHGGKSPQEKKKTVMPLLKRTTSTGSKLIRRLSYRLKLSTIEESSLEQ